MYRSFCFSLPLDLSPIALHISLVDAASRSLCTRFPPLPSLLGAERLSTCTVPLPAALHHLTVLSSPAGEPQGFLRASLCLPSLVWLPRPFCPRPAQSGPCQTQVSSVQGSLLLSACLHHPHAQLPPLSGFDQ